jgi:peroxiredoxin
MKDCTCIFSTFPGALLVVAFLLVGTVGQAALEEKQSKETQKIPLLPAQLVDIDGLTIDLQKLARKKRLIFVTLKATWCSVCANQLIRLAQLKTRLNTCGATFVVLSPGPRKDLKAIKKRTEFPYPFIEDKNLKLARQLDLVLAPGQIQPAIFEVNQERIIIWMQHGRNGVYYGDQELFEHLDCANVETALLPILSPPVGGGYRR